MAKKAVAKFAVKASKKSSKKSSKKAASKTAIKKAAVVQESSVLQEQSQTVQASETQTVPVMPAEAEVSVSAPDASPPDSASSISTTSVEQSQSAPAVQAQSEENVMGEESKGVGKEYNPSEFSQPATQAGTGSSKVYLYVGLSVVVLAAIVGGLFFVGGFGSSSQSELTGSTIVAYCSDTDGGYNRFTKGVAEGTYYLNYESGEYMDTCSAAEDNKLTEYYCKNDLVVYSTEPCPDGMTCMDGICA